MWQLPSGRCADPTRSPRSAPRRSEPRPTGRLLVPLVIAGAAVVVLTTALEGQARFTRSPGNRVRRDGGRSTTTHADRAGAAGPGEAPSRRRRPTSSRPVLLVLGCVVALVVAALLIRLIASAIQRPPTPAEAAGPPRARRGGGAAGGRRARRAPRDRGGARGARRGARAERRGRARRLACSRLRRTPGSPGRPPRPRPSSPAACSAGRALIGPRCGPFSASTCRARFGDGAISAADASGARQALQALEASWEHVPA